MGTIVGPVGSPPLPANKTAKNLYLIYHDFAKIYGPAQI
jgi:hypothetical protein